MKSSGANIVDPLETIMGDGQFPSRSTGTYLLSLYRYRGRWWTERSAWTDEQMGSRMIILGGVWVATLGVGVAGVSVGAHVGPRAPAGLWCFDAGIGSWSRSGGWAGAARTKLGPREPEPCS